jgi:hypothetical protein
MAKQSGKAEHHPRAVVIHGLKHARIACLAAREYDIPVELHSAPGAAASLGPHWFQKILEEIEGEFTDVRLDAVLDCADSAGFALAALRQGLKRIRFSGPRKTAAKICDIARQNKAVIDRGWPVTLDLAQEDDPEAACRDWFSGGTRRP